MRKHLSMVVMFAVSAIAAAAEVTPSQLVLEVVALSNKGEVKFSRHECKEGKDINLTGLFAWPFAGNVHITCLDATKAEVKADLQLVGGFVAEPKIEQKAVLFAGGDQSIDLAASGAILTVKPALIKPADESYPESAPGPGANK